MKQNLLSKSLQIYVLYASITVGVCSVFFYFYLDQLFQEEAVEYLQQSKFELLKSIQTLESNAEIDVWNEAHENAKIKPVTTFVSSKVFQKKIYSQHEEESIPFLFLEESIQTKHFTFAIQLRANLIENDDLIESISSVFALLLLLLVGGMIFVTKISTKKLWKPFYSTLHAMNDFELKQTQPIDFQSSSIIEFNQLNQSIELLMRNNQLTYQEQKRFVENAAHELQTPIALISGQLNALSQTKELSSSQAEIIEKIDHAVNRIARLNKNLLVLSKLESVYFQADEINFSQKLEHYCEMMKEIAASKDIGFQVEIELNCTVQSHAIAVESIIENLLSNAINHNFRFGLIRVKLTNKGLFVSNTGIDTPLNTNELYNRFQRGTTQSSGNGLGLAIVKSSAQQNNWKLDYSFEDTLHQFSVLFKS